MFVMLSNRHNKVKNSNTPLLCPMRGKCVRITSRFITFNNVIICH